MAKLSKEDLKKIFVPGYMPTQTDWWNLLDSFVHLDAQTFIDAQIVNTKVSAYDTALKAQNVDGTVNTLGDVFKVLQGYSDGRSINNELKWSGLPGKPSKLNLAWTEQTIATDQSMFNPLGSSGSSGSGPNTRWLGSTVGGVTGTYLIVDIKTERHWITSSTETGFYVDQTVAIKVAITPNVPLS